MKLQNEGVLWLSGVFCGAAAMDSTVVMGVAIANWNIVITELMISLVVGLLAFHPWTGGDRR